MAIGIVILGLVTGIFSMMASSRLLSNTTPARIHRWLRRRSGKNEGVDLQRAKVAITTRYNSSLVRPMFPVLAATALVLVYFVGEWVAEGHIAVDLLLVFLAAVVGCYPFMVHVQLSDYRKKFSTLAARLLVRRASPAEAGAILVEASAHSDPHVRFAATMGLRELGTNSGMEALQKLSDDSDHRVAGEARDAVSDLLPVLKGNAMLSVRTMETYVQEHQFLEKSRGSSRPDKVHEAFDKLYEITNQIDEIVFSQLPIRRSYPDVFCMDCYARAEDMRYEDWQWVRCKRCKEVHGLKIGVEKVVGQIGGDGDRALDNGLLYLNLWDEGNRKARYAELDVLEIVGGKPLNYDWAVSAVVDKMHNQHHGQANRISVKLVGNPSLEVNTLHLLRTLDSSVMGS